MSGTREPVHFGGLELDPIMCVVRYRGKSLKQEAIEYRVLAFLMRGPTRLVPYRTLAEGGLGWVEYDEPALPKLFGKVAHFINKRLHEAGAPYSVDALNGGLVLREMHGT